MGKGGMIKHDGMIDVETVQRLTDDGLVSRIKYAVVRDAPRRHSFLKSLAEAVDAVRIVSGIGERPALADLRDFGWASFTSGCVCVAPALSVAMLKAIKQKVFAAAERIRGQFAPLESLRDKINAVRVFHAAVRLAGIADTGPVTHSGRL
jgi:dihydrodipicolinate synthase/N-acetylneuraminate lyase